ncbi:hypothetical protein QCA50_008978 [Cerrena zonata]|uniref:F-box domain-containing protein n=1 Tax=Cerrena zonata TaxID=2478898 RepID=A0AAW0GC97_9APHY
MTPTDTIPDEIWLHIALFAELKALFALRLTCRKLSLLTHDRLIWIKHLQTMAHHDPIPPVTSRLLSPYYTCDSEREAGTSTVEAWCGYVRQTKNSWLNSRSASWPLNIEEALDPGSGLQDKFPLTILSIDVFRDRWLLVVYREKLLELWDLYPQLSTGLHPDALNTHPSESVCRVRVQNPRLAEGTSCASTLTADGTTLVVGVTGDPSVTLLFRFPLDFSNAGRIRAYTVTEYQTPSQLHQIRTLSPETNIIIFSRLHAVTVMHMETHEAWLVSAEEDDEETWNGVIGAIPLIERQLLCVKAHSVEFMTCMQSEATPIADPNIIRHRLAPSTTFRSVSFSTPCVTQDGDDTSVSVTFLAYDSLHGIYNYRVIADFVSSSFIPVKMTLELLAVHEMAQLTATTRAGYTPGARAFVSACALGLQGRRGVWVQRKRNSMERALYAFTMDPNREAKEGEAAPIEEKLIYVENSFDLRDDITHCAFAESTGLVILGKRSGELLVV